jgi:NAD(P)-dependent dehydrogenase (short-subunit alcohol dehydrogenase family)
MEHYPELKNRDVLVTGGAHGIGEAVVRAFHEQGARVCFCDIDDKAGHSLSKQLGEGALFTKVDLLKEEDIRRWIDGVGAHENTVRALVNNPAADPRIPLESTSSKSWDTLFALNLRACFLACREAAKWMGEGSAIVNLASFAFHSAPAHMSAYVASKGGVIGFTRSLARELGPRRIRVNALSPGWVLTDHQLRAHPSSALKRQIRHAQCVPDLITPDEIADVVLFLAGDASSAITGQEILADRGWAHS